jgi:hypothetical protein
MATFPFSSTTPNMTFDEDNITDEEFTDDDDDDITMPELDLNNLYDENDDEDDEDYDENGEHQISPIGDLARLMNLGKQTGAFPMKAGVPIPSVFLGKTAMPTPTPSPFPTAFPTPTISPFPTPTPTPTPTAFPQSGRLTLSLLPTTKQPITTPNFPGNISPVQLTTLTLSPTVVPQIRNVIPAVTTGLSQNIVPNIPSIRGMTLSPVTFHPQPTINALHMQIPGKSIDVEAILSKMPGISVIAVTSNPEQVQANINDVLKKETDETSEDFEARRRLTMQLANIPNYKLSNATAVVAGLIMMKKSKLGVNYDPDVEAAIRYLMALLQQ